MSRSFPAVLCMAATALLCGACSTIVEGTDQSVQVVTDPPGAACTLERGGTSIAVVNPTPGSVTVDKSKDTIDVTCDKDGYQETAGVLDSSFEGMTFGNVLFGGIIGVAVDASSGAMNQYPSSIAITMTPESFSSVAARDSYFDARVAEVRKEHDADYAKAQDTAVCVRDPKGEACGKVKAKVDDRRDAQIARLDEQRSEAVIQ